MTRPALSSLRAIGFAAAAVCVASAILPPALAATKAAKPAPKSGAKDEASKPALVGTFGDWNVFVGEVGKGRICYTLAQPKSREPASLTRDPGYAFISDRPAEGVRNEVSFIMGFDVSRGRHGGSEAPMPSRVRNRLRSRAPNRRRPPPSANRLGRPDAVRDASQGREPLGQERGERERVDRVMRKGTKLVVKAASLRGHQSIDTYALTGFAQAMDRLQKECPGSDAAAQAPGLGIDWIGVPSPAGGSIWDSSLPLFPPSRLEPTSTSIWSQVDQLEDRFRPEAEVVAFDRPTAPRRKAAIRTAKALAGGRRSGEFGVVDFPSKGSPERIGPHLRAGGSQLRK